MKTTPILMQSPLVSMSLRGLKGQTRRGRGLEQVNEHPDEWESGAYDMRDGRFGAWFNHVESSPRGIGDGTRPGAIFIPCPYSGPGDLIYMREACRAVELPDTGRDGVRYADDQFIPIAETMSAGQAWLKLFTYRDQRGALVPGVHMPRWASRLTGKLLSVSVERLQDISDSDALAEGIPDEIPRGPGYARDKFGALIRKINGPECWYRNNWNWVLVYEPIAKNVDRVLEETAA
jgi:hypothetical protein